MAKRNETVRSSEGRISENQRSVEHVGSSDYKKTGADGGVDQGERGFGRSPVFIREGGSIPIVNAFTDQLGSDTLLLGWGVNRYLIDQLELVHRSMALLATTSLAAEGRGDMALEEHRAIVEAIGSQDGDAAADAVKQHLSFAFGMNGLRMSNPMPATQKRRFKSGLKPAKWHHRLI